MMKQIYMDLEVLMNRTFLIFVSIQLFIASVKGTNFKCDSSLGMESSQITDDNLSASSSYVKSVSPVYARARIDKGGGAWCPSSVIKSGVNEWLEINLNSDHVITAVETQGRYGKGQGQEYAEAFRIEYWRETLQEWAEYHNATGGNVLTGNSNPWHSVKQQLDHPFVASKIRFFPYSVHPRTVCMRVEMYGCKWTNPLDSYELLNETGVHYGYYDGNSEDKLLMGGLGTLADEIVEAFDPLDEEEDQENVLMQRVVIFQSGQRKNFSVTFRFHSLRKFRSLTISFATTLEYTLPSAIYFAIPGYSPFLTYKPVVSGEEYLNNLTLPLNEKICQNLEVIFLIERQKVAISEIAFNSDEFNGKLSLKEEEFEKPLLNIQKVQSVQTTSSSMSRNTPERETSKDQTIQLIGVEYRTYVAVLAAILTVGIVITTMVFIWLIVKCFQKKKAMGSKNCWEKWCKRRTVQPSNELYGFARMSGESDSDTSSTVYQEPYRATTLPINHTSVVSQDEIETLMRRDRSVMLTPRNFQPPSCRTVGSQNVVRYPFQPLCQSQVIYSSYMTPARLPEKHYASSSILKVFDPATCSMATENNGYSHSNGRYS
ncbi:discoidin domain-containing receptor tyrosine kinase B-like [Artemia franciscana]|uniref:discoidin domain-containing receptor tyrosine kinase B-like n=1 Tax=Artemia franciscana TaxID=6661 RepID=UPI0032DBBCC8